MAATYTVSVIWTNLLNWDNSPCLTEVLENFIEPGRCWVLLLLSIKKHRPCLGTVRPDLLFESIWISPTALTIPLIHPSIPSCRVFLGIGGERYTWIRPRSRPCELSVRHLNNQALWQEVTILWIGESTRNLPLTFPYSGVFLGFPKDPWQSSKCCFWQAFPRGAREAVPNILIPLLREELFPLLRASDKSLGLESRGLVSALVPLLSGCAAKLFGFSEPHSISRKWE